MLSCLVEIQAPRFRRHLGLLDGELRVIVRLVVVVPISKAREITRNEKRGIGDEGGWEEGFDLAMYGYR
jgi:hypothetical protein